MYLHTQPATGEADRIAARAVAIRDRLRNAIQGNSPLAGTTDASAAHDTEEALIASRALAIRQRLRQSLATAPASALRG